MKLTTTFWSDEVHSFDKLFYINGHTEEIVAQTDLNNKFQTIAFFKFISKFVTSKKVLMLTKQKWQYKTKDYFQFAVLVDGKITHIKWFDLHVNNTTKLSHDIAFDTTLISKNDVRMPFGHFPMYYYRKNLKTPLYREQNLKAKAYKFMGNIVQSTL